VGFEVETVKFLIHAGLDKAGSTALQAHLYENRSWLAERGVHVLEIALGRFGHRELFRDFNRGLWSRVVDELESARGSGARFALASFEGIAALPEPALDTLADLPGTGDACFLFYLRDQAALLQSGYLQRLKAGPQRYSVLELRENPSLLFETARDYRSMLERFSQRFTHERLRFMSYRAGPGWDIVSDLLDQLGCEEDEDFTRLSMAQNPSLDVPAACLINDRDNDGINASDREQLVDDLLLLIRGEGSGQRYFLNRAAIERLREHYRPSNRQLLRDFGIAEGVDSFFGYDAAIWCDALDDQQMRLRSQRLEFLNRFYRWNGRPLEGVELGMLTSPGSGWKAATGEGLRSDGNESGLAFRIPLSRHAQVLRDIRLCLRGSYPTADCRSRVCLNGVDLGWHNLADWSTDLGAESLGPYRHVELELRHDGSSRYLLQGASFERL
jgi:hypothetical protein